MRANKILQHHNQLIENEKDAFLKDESP